MCLQHCTSIARVTSGCENRFARSATFTHVVSRQMEPENTYSCKHAKSSLGMRSLCSKCLDIQKKRRVLGSRHLQTSLRVSYSEGIVLCMTACRGLENMCFAKSFLLPMSPGKTSASGFWANRARKCPEVYWFVQFPKRKWWWGSLHVSGMHSFAPAPCIAPLFYITSFKECRTICL